MRRPLALAAALVLPLPALAQDEERDRGFIAGLIEDNLSSPGLQVRIDGFEGALSSAASLETLQVSDREGVWLTLQDVVLDWNRSALLRGRLEVDELSAGLIRVERAPLPAEGVEALPDAGASGGFSLPDLPVSVEIGALQADRIELGEALAGQDLALSLDASARLADGSGAATIEARRLDGTEGTFSIDVAYAAEGQVLDVDVAIAEAEGGIAATLLRLPGAPAIELAVAGSGPLDAFAADVTVASDGTERLGGTVALTGVEDGRRLDVDVAGDVTSLFAPRYRPFFGDDVALAASALRRDDGRLELDALDLRTRALTLEGAARLGADGWPEFLDVTGALRSEDGTPVLLPTGSRTSVRDATLSLAYDAAVSDEIALTLAAREVVTEAAEVASASVDVTGTIGRSDGIVATARAAVSATLDGLAFVDPALAEAAGERIALSADVAWVTGAPVEITGLALEGDDYGLDGSVAVIAADVETPLTLRLDLDAALADLSRIAGVAELEGLSGSAEATLAGDYAPVAGAFDLALDATADALTLGIEQADALLEGETALSVAARRTVEGTFLDALSLSNAQASVEGSAALIAPDAPSGEAGRATLRARIEDGTRIDPRLDGPVTFAADVAQDAGGVWQGSVDATAPEGATLSARGDLTGDAPDVTFDASVPEVAAYVDGVPGGLDLSGRAFRRDGVWSVEADAAGPWDATARVSGPVTGEAPRIAFDATLPDATGPIPALASQPALAGPVTLTGVATQAGAVWSVDAAVDAPAGIALTVSGPVTGNARAIAFEATIDDLAVPVPALEAVPALGGPARLAGDLTEVGGAFALDARLDAPAGIVVRARGPVTGEAVRLEIAATVPAVETFVPAVEGRLDLDGAVFSAGEDYAAEVTARGPYGAVVTAQTVLTASPLRVGFTADIADLSQLAPVPGGLSVAGEAVQTDDGFRIDVDGTGPYDATLDATVDLVDGAPSVTATGRVPEAAALLPQLSGPVDYEVAVEQVDGQFRVDAAVDGAQAIRATVSGIATGPEADLDFDLSVGDVAPFAPGLNGALDASGRAFQSDGQWNVDVDATGPLRSTLDAQAVVTGPALSAEFALAVPDIGPLVPDISGPLRIDGTARQDGERYAIDVDLDGPSGTRAAVAGSLGTDLTLDLSVEGAAPLGLANAALEPRRLAGEVRFDLDIDGPAGLDAVSGTVSTTGAALSLPTLRNALEGIDATIRLGSGRAQVEATANVESGGSVAVSGPVGLQAPFPAELAARFAVTAVDPQLYTADLAGQITVTGPLAGGAVIAGAIGIDGAEIRVPSSGITGVGDLPDITFVNSPRPVRRTLALAGQDAASQAERARAEANGGGGPGYGLDIAIDAPGRIFVRGRGLDAELGGTLRLRGTTSDPVTVGGFELVRGRLDILEQRFDLDEGRIAFTGGLVPTIRLVARTQTDTITAAIVVEGPADAIEVRFESSPEVPQEEIVAQIFFGRDLSELSPLQAIQLANSIAVLSGRSNGGLLDRVRGSAGLDDLDITTDDEGNVAVRAGKYLTDNVYTDVQINQEGEAELSLNLDVSPSLTVRGGVGATGDTSLGLFFERDF